MKTSLLAVILICFFYSSQAQFVQWRGPNRDGQFTETGLLKEWPAEGPKQVLQVDKLGKGWSSPIYVDGMIYITGMIDTLDYLSAVDMQGNIKYQVPYGRSWNQSYPDTRCSPVVEDNRIYVQSGTGRVVCFNRETGKENWAVEVDKDFEGEYHVWGNSETPLIIDDKLICSPGGDKTSVVALNKLTGETVWESKSLGGARAYASATIYQYKDLRYILAVIGTDILALVPETGEIAWHYRYFDPEKWKFQDNGLIWTNTPLFKDNEIFLSMGYDYDAVMLQMAEDGKSVSEKYRNTVLDNHHGGLVLYDGKVYGSNWENNSKGNWVCMDWDTGDINYEEPWDSKGAMIMDEGLLYAYNERGNVALVQPDPSGFNIISEFKINEGSGPHWAHPFISDGKLFMRHGEVMMVYDIKEK